MASMTSSSRRSTSSSYCSSACYSTSSSYRSNGSLGGSSDSQEPLYEPFVNTAVPSYLFEEDGTGGSRSSCLASFSPHARSSFGLSGPVDGAQVVCHKSTGGVSLLGDRYYVSADVSQFQPHDIAVMAYNQHVVIHAEKVMDDGSVSDTFTHQSLFPEDMDPLSVCGTFRSDGILVVSVRRMPTLGGLDCPCSSQ
ncbi:heat shock protein beta-7-like [Thalassophryne amazonica]|uniref:heat shock protein beta-7-like n=1 Tax=Thalassophryne amazonica TaxID=390379 RepID=UPI0014710507|nr:heat shock protein beta-7-like [Thalassophryne amazonica]